MRAKFTITGKDIVRMILEKYPYVGFEYLDIVLQETQEHWEKQNRKKFIDLKEMPELKREEIRLYFDGSFTNETT